MTFYNGDLYVTHLGATKIYKVTLAGQATVLAGTPETTIKYSTPRAMRVILEIYNLHGSEARTLIEQNQGAGVQSVQWDGRNNNGEIAASGVYVYSLSMGDFVLSKKMLLLR